jgi:hypothetical protein
VSDVPLLLDHNGDLNTYGFGHFRIRSPAILLVLAACEPSGSSSEVGRLSLQTGLCVLFVQQALMNQWRLVCSLNNDLGYALCIVRFHLRFVRTAGESLFYWVLLQCSPGATRVSSRPVRAHYSNILAHLPRLGRQIFSRLQVRASPVLFTLSKLLRRLNPLEDCRIADAASLTYLFTFQVQGSGLRPNT